MAFWNREFLPTRWGERTLSPLLDVDDLFERFRREFFSPDQLRGMGEGFMPRIEMKETDKNIIVSAELPGMNEKDINVTLRENNLILEGEKKTEKKREEKGFYSSEFSYGSFYRSIPLHAEVDSDSVEARYRDGVLEVTLRKLEESRQNSKRIEIRH
jgi:HSP20 family protein